MMPSRASYLGPLTPAGLALLLLAGLAAAVFALWYPRVAHAHNVVASGAYTCTGGWTYSADYVNGGGEGAPDNRLVIVDVNIGGTNIREYHYFDTLTSHPPAPTGYSIVDHPTVETYTIFSLAGSTSPITVSGSMKVYDGGSTFQPSGDPAYKRYLPQYSLNPIPQVSPATGCPTSTPTPSFTPTPTHTATPTHTSTPTDTPTATPTSTPTPTATQLPSFGALALTVDKTSVAAGVAAVPLADVPFAAFGESDSTNASKLSSIKLSSILLSSIKLSSIDLGSTKLSSIELSSVKLSSIPISRPGGWEAILEGTSLQGVPLQEIEFVDVFTLDPPPAALSPSSPEPLTLADVDLSGTALKPLSLAAVALGPTKLSSIAPPEPSSDWCEALAAAGSSCADLGYTTSDIGTATLLELNVKGVKLSSIKLSSIKLSSIDLAEAGIASLKLSSIAVRDLKLSSIKLSSIPLSTVTDGSLSSVKLSSIDVPDGQPSWCDYIASQSFDCVTLGLTEDSTLSEVEAAFAAGGTSLASSPIGPLKLSSIKLSSIDLAAVKLSSISLDSIAIQGTKLSSIKLSSIDVTQSDLGSVKLSSIPAPEQALVVDCSLVDCVDGTLAQAQAAGALKPDATLGHLGSYGNTTVQDILVALGLPQDAVEYFLSFFYGDALLGDVANDPIVNLDELTLGDLFLAILVRSDYPWEELPLDALLAADLPSASGITYRASFTNSGGSAPSTLEVELPAGFRHVPGTSELEVVRGGNTTVTPIGDPEVDGTTHTWALDGFMPGDEVTVVFDVRPGVALGVRTSSIALSAPGFAGLSAQNQAAVNISENFEPNGDPATAPVVDADVLYLSHISSADDRDFFRVAALPSGSRLAVYLSHQSQDNDVAVFRPEPEILREPAGTKLSSIPLGDAEPDILESSPPPGTLQDIELAELPLTDLSDQRGTSDDTVSALSIGESGFYTLEFVGYNGATSDDPFVFRVKVTPPPPVPGCDPRAFPFAGQGSVGTLPSNLSAATNTLFIASQRRLAELYGPTSAADVMGALAGLSGRSDLGVSGAVLPVDADPAVADAFAAWDQAPCSPAAANDVVAAINALVDGYRLSLPNLQNIVVVGSDSVIPFARVPDLTRISNERDYTSDAAAINGGSELIGSFITENVLSDNPYGAFHPLELLNRQVFLPEVALGRLVETPDQIVAQVDQFETFEGRLDPSTSMTTGYDFLADGADAVADELDVLVGALNSLRMINDTWTSGDLSAAFEESAQIPDVASLNTHFDHYRLLPGAGNTTGDESDLYTTDNIARAATDPVLLAGRILFSMGCHSGLNVPDLIAPSPAAEDAARLLDWPQAFADQSAAIYVANTGYGYGDTEKIAYSEQLMALFARNLSQGMTAGEALSSAKREYYGGLVHFQTYDEKVLAQATFYGLPMFAVGDPPGGGADDPPPPAPQFINDPITGLSGIELQMAPAFELVDQGADGKYYAIDGRTESTAGRPIMPVTGGVDLPPGLEGATARGIVITDLQSIDEFDFDPVFSRPDSDTALPEQPSAGTFPSSIHTLNSFYGPGGLEQQAMFMPAQFIPDAQDPATGTHRRYTNLTAFVPYSNSPDVTPPTILDTHAATVGGVVTFAAAVEDDLPNNVARVAVLYKPETSGQWSLVDLVLAPGSDRWTGAAFLSGSVQYTVYALDTAGNVALSTNKGEFHQTIAAPVQSGVSVVVSGTQAQAGWLLDASISIVGPDGVPLTYKIDNGPSVPYIGPFPITGTGVHVVAATGSDGSTGGAIVPIDNAGPQAAFTAPLDGATYDHGATISAAYTCLDAGSGVVSCEGTVADGTNVDTSTLGQHTFEVSSEDLAGNTRLTSITYTVAACADPDVDCDGVLNATDNCAGAPNPDQANNDKNLIANPVSFPSDRTRIISDPTGDVCDDDDDNDGLLDTVEGGSQPCASASAALNPLLADTDGDRFLDGVECAAGTNPASSSSVPPLSYCGPSGDTDVDRVPDPLERCFYGSSVGNLDSDGDRAVDGAMDGCEVASINGDRIVNSGDHGLLGAAIARTLYHVNFDLNKDGMLSSGDQGLMASLFLPGSQCP